MPRCGWPKPGPSIAPYARPTVLPFVRWKSFRPGRLAPLRSLKSIKVCDPDRRFPQERRMRTKIPGLSRPRAASALVEGSYRARVIRFGPAGHAAKPCLAATFLILEPAAYAGRFAGARLYYHDRALW